MDIEKIESFMDNFDLAELLPKAEEILTQVDVLMRGVVLIAPLVLFVLGILYCFAYPREANHSFGYRFFWGMSSVQAWQTMQRVAGIVWGLLGLGLGIAMYVISGGYAEMETMDIIWSAVKCVLWELGLLAVSCIVIDIVIVVLFDSKGNRRGRKAAQTAK